MKKVYLIVLALFMAIITSFFVSCTGEPSMMNSNESVKLTNDEVSFFSKIANEGKILSPEQAVNRALSSPFDQSRTRTNNNVTRIEAISKSAYGQYGDSILKMLPDTLFYIISTDDGFSTVVSADRRMSTTVLGRIPQSQLYNISDETDWTIRGLLYKMFANAVVSEVCDFESKRDSMKTILFNKLHISEKAGTRALDDPIIDPDDYDFFEVYGPAQNYEVLKNSMVPQCWGQYMPYNRFVRYKKPCGTVPTGCVAVAVGQLMAYWGHPSTIDGHSMNWSQVNSHYYYSPSDSLLAGAVDIAYLLQRIGEGINTNYQCDGSSAILESGKNWLLSHGYQGGSQSSFNYNVVRISLNNNRPVLISGKSYDTNEGYVGHSWIIDGYREINEGSTLTIYGIHKVTHEQIIFYQGIVYSTYYYLSNNFGNYNPHTWISGSGYNDCTFNQGFGVYQYFLTTFTELRPSN